jgi:hypothetical protein
MRCLVQLFIDSFGASWLSKMYQEPLYTMAKGRDHEIVRALENHPKTVPQRI